MFCVGSTLQKHRANPVIRYCNFPITPLTNERYTYLPLGGEFQWGFQSGSVKHAPDKWCIVYGTQIFYTMLGSEHLTNSSVCHFISDTPSWVLVSSEGKKSCPHALLFHSFHPIASIRTVAYIVPQPFHIYL